MEAEVEAEPEVTVKHSAIPTSRSHSTLARRWLTNITMACFFLCGGIEYSVILPTCWDYMHGQFGAHKWLYGLAISAMSISNFLIGPIMGAIYDKTHQTKLLVLFLNLFEIGGNFMYFAASSKHMVLGSRFITGVGVSAGAVLFGEIARTSRKKERTVAFSIFMSARQVGLVIGPGLNLFLRICNFKLGPFVVDKYRSPALFMMIVWLVIQVMFIFFFSELPTVTDEEPDKQEHDRDSPLPPDIDDETIRSGDISFPSEKETINNTTNKGYGSINAEHTSLKDSRKFFIVKKWASLRLILYEFVTEEVVLLLAILFITLFNQQVLETGLVPLVEDFFKWNEFDISLFYSGAGITLLISFFCVAMLTKILSDRWLIVIGIAGTLFGFAWYVGLMGSGKSHSYTLAVFIVGAFINVFTIPYVFVPASSLYSKFIPLRIQGFGQGVRRSVTALSCIMGPLWGHYGLDQDLNLHLVVIIIHSLLFH